MPKSELTPTGILHKYSQTGELPESLMPIQPFGSVPEDPTKPLRSSVESILLARSSIQALKLLGNFWVRQKLNPLVRDKMIPVEEIDQLEDGDKRDIALDDKVQFVLDSFQGSMRRTLIHELAPKNELWLPMKVNSAYKLLLQEEGVQESVDGIMEAGVSLSDQVKDLFYSANEFYDGYLGYEASTRQIVDLVGNSYDTSTHLETGFHNKATEQTGTYYSIAPIGGIDRIVVLDPSFHHKVEKEMRARGEIRDQSTHCPFAMNSRFTNPFQNPGRELIVSNPLKHVFESLVRKYIGS